MHINIHGLPIDVSVGDEALDLVARDLLSHFEVLTSRADPLCRLHFRHVDDLANLPPIPTDAEVVASQPRAATSDDPFQGWTVYRSGEEIHVEFNVLGRLSISPDHRRADGFLVRPPSPEQDIRINLMHFALVELLKFLDVYTIHASALERDGRGILIPGHSGQGKTTTCIALLRAGYRCLADDHPLLRREQDGLRLLAFPEKMDVTEQTVAFFPELRDNLDALEPGLFKRSFNTERLFPHAPVESAAPGIILFPRVVPWRKSHMERLSKSRAMEQLLPHGFRVLNREVARRHFDVLVDLVHRSECYTLYSGEDVLEIPALIDPLFDAPRTDRIAAALT